MKTVQIDDETEKMLSEYCQRMNVSETEAVKQGIRWMYSRLKIKYNWAHTWNSKGEPAMSEKTKWQIFFQIESGEPITSLAKAYGVSRQTIYNVKKYCKDKQKSVDT